MSTTTILNRPIDPMVAPTSGVTAPRISLRRLVRVELRKSFDTRSGLGLLGGTALAAAAASLLVIAFSPVDQLTYQQFALAACYPMSVVLPLIAVLSVTAEWSQRSGLSTFTLVPHRSRVIVAKGLAMLVVALAATIFALPLAALATFVGSAIRGVDPIWNLGLSDAAYFAVANVFPIAVGFMFGVVLRASAGAIVGYFVFAFVAPTMLTFLAMSQAWFRHAQPWTDPNYSQHALLHGGFGAQQWAQLGVTSAVWVIAPLLVGAVALLRSEVK
jgi:ABC-2 type transport system permease protein